MSRNSWERHDHNRRLIASPLGERARENLRRCGEALRRALKKRPTASDDRKPRKEG